MAERSSGRQALPDSEPSPDFGAEGFSHTLLTEILESIAAGICVWDRDLRLVTWNASYPKINVIPQSVLRSGVRLADILNASAPLLDDPRSGEELEALAREHLKRNGRLDIDRVLADGRIVSVNFHAFSAGGWIAIYRDVTERRQAFARVRQSERALKLQNMRLDVSLNSMPHGFSIWDEDRRLVLWNTRFAEIYGVANDLLRTGMSLLEFCEASIGVGCFPDQTGFENHNLYQSRFDDTAAPQAVGSYEKAVGDRAIRSTYSRTPGIGWVVTLEDVTEQKAQLRLAAEREAKIHQQFVRFEAVVNNMPLSVVMFDRDSRLVIGNRNYAKIYNLPPELVRPGTPLQDIINYRLAHGTHPTDKVDYFNDRLEIVRRGKRNVTTVELEDGRTILIRHQPLPDGGWISTQEDITERRRKEERISHLARHDPLTDLPNRSHLRENMELAEARIRRGESMAVLFVDLDHFKGVNDTLGHSVGDAVLQAVADRLNVCTREGDIVARLGGDEFAVLQAGLERPEEAASLAGRIVEAIAEPFEVQGHHVLIGASIGIAIAPADGENTDTLMKNADLALYRAKSDGRGAFHFFEPGMDSAIQERRIIEVGLRHALPRHELRLVYQPIIRLADNRPCAAEALLRWDHPVRGTVPPQDFVPVAEDTGLIIPIGEWVLREACAAAALWPEEIAVAVNLSPAQIKNRGLVDQVRGALKRSGIAPSRLEIEITESLLLSNSDQTINVLHQLRALGVRISMDDFGTGYSSLSHLRCFPFDKIKIDRSFVRDLASRGDSRAIVNAVVALGNNLGIVTTAEGVETETQLGLVRQEGCTEAQGFLFSPPLPAAAATEMFAMTQPGRDGDRELRAMS